MVTAVSAAFHAHPVTGGAGELAQHLRSDGFLADGFKHCHCTVGIDARLITSRFEGCDALLQFGTKTPSDTIDRIVREAMEELGIERDDVPETAKTTTSDGSLEFETAPGLAFTKPLSASINGKSVTSPRWSSMLLTMIAQLKSKGFDGD